MQDPQTAGFGAKCAIHPERTATRTCGRCGNFTCDECNDRGVEAMCPTCRAISGTDQFPFTRDSYSFGGVWNYAFEKWKREWVMLSVCVLILVAVGFVAVLFNSLFQGIAAAAVGERGGRFGVFYIAVLSSVMSQVVSMLAQGTFQMGLIRILIDVLNGKKADVGRIMTQLPKLGRYIAQMILIQLMVVVPFALYALLLAIVAAVACGLSFTEYDSWTHMSGVGIAVLALGGLAAIPVMIYAVLPLAFVNMELVYGDVGPAESIRRSYLIARGHRFNILGMGVIAFLIFMVGLIACCVGIIPAWGLAYLLLTGLYLALRNGSGLPPPVET